MNQHVTVETTTRVTVDQSTDYQDAPPPSDYGTANAVAMIGIIGLFLVVVAVVGLFLVEVLPDLLEFVIELGQAVAVPAAIVGGVVLAIWLLVAAGNVVVDMLQAAIVIVTLPVWLPIYGVYLGVERVVWAIQGSLERRQQLRQLEAQRPIVIVVQSQEAAQRLLASHSLDNVRIVDVPARKQLMEVK